MTEKSKVNNIYFTNEGDSITGTVVWLGEVENQFEKKVPRVLLRNDDGTFGLTGSHKKLGAIIKDLTVGEVVTLSRGAMGEGEYAQIEYSRS